MKDQIKIDEIDAKILKILLAESRTSFTDIAKECKITVTAVRMRYKQLWKKGVINGENMLVNPHSLGYRHIVDLLIMDDVENEKEAAKFIESKPYISEVVSPFGKYNFLGKVALRNLNRLHDIIEELESNINIKHVDALIWAEAVNVEYPQNLIIKPLNRENDRKINNMQALIDHDLTPLEIDEIDRKIAKTLSENSRTPFKKIAKELGLSSKAVIQRYKKLRGNLLTLSTVTLDLNKLGYTALENLYIKVLNRSKMSDIYSQLLEIPNLIVIIRLTGTYDLYAAVALEDFDKMFEANEQIRKINGIEMEEVVLTPMPPSWPLNLFPSLLENESMQPKYWANRTKYKSKDQVKLILFIFILKRKTFH